LDHPLQSPKISGKTIEPFRKSVHDKTVKNARTNTGTNLGFSRYFPQI